MKTKNILIFVVLFLFLATLLTSCNSSPLTPTEPGSPAPSGTGSSTNEDKIASLEAQIIALMQSQQTSTTEQKKLLDQLKAELDALKSTDTPKDTSTPVATEPPTSFKYTLENGRAVITSIISNEESVTVPAVIDGYRVYSIGTEALTSDSVHSLTISAGIEKIDWFAFSGCFSLSYISIPESVTSVGYGAFDNTASNLTIRCKRDSFAHKYAQSYGITYDIT